MTRLFRPLAVTTAVLGTATLGAMAVTGDPGPNDPAPAPRPAAAGERAGWRFAVEPKPLSDAITRGLKFLAERQNPDGGWSQGGGWRSSGGGRQEGANVDDPSDVGNTCVTLLAFLRAGHTPTAGEYKEHVAKGLRFVCERVEKSDAKDLYVTDVRNTQLQSKIGPYVDTFLTTLVLAELKDTAGPDEKRLMASLDKAVSKVAANQKADGTFAGNGGWAPVLSQGVANKALARAKLRGANVSDEVLARVGKQSADSLNGTAVAAAGPAPSGGLIAGRSGIGGGGMGGGDAGVRLYRESQGVGGQRDAANAANAFKKEAEKVLADATAKPADKEAAKKQVAEADKLEQLAREAETKLAVQARDGAFVRGFGSNGGEEFLSFLNISETLVVKGGAEWTAWDGKMQQQLPKAQDKDGGWSGHHCITGRTFCTASALLVLLADRTQFPADAIAAARAERKPAEKPNDKK
ncbi:MAG: prenyltransferase/squalene oxidase repeat-containing protein [Gemmataceae bacterium]